jgi:hypothetical protein
MILLAEISAISYIEDVPAVFDGGWAAINMVKIIFLPRSLCSAPSCCSEDQIDLLAH